MACLAHKLNPVCTAYRTTVIGEDGLTVDLWLQDMVHGLQSCLFPSEIQCRFRWGNHWLPNGESRRKRLGIALKRRCLSTIVGATEAESEVHSYQFEFISSVVVESDLRVQIPLPMMQDSVFVSAESILKGYRKPSLSPESRCVNWWIDHYVD